jgi:hypothetical protein
LAKSEIGQGLSLYIINIHLIYTPESDYFLFENHNNCLSLAHS